MCDERLKKLILSFKKNNIEDFAEIYAEFKALILHYSKNLGTDDAIQELNLFFIELLYEINLSKFKGESANEIQRYIAVCIRNKYIRLSTLNTRYCNTFNDLEENCILTACNFEDSLVVREALELLPPKQRIILVYKYMYLYSDYEIACMLQISRQAVNQLKNRALKALREFFKDLI